VENCKEQIKTVYRVAKIWRDLPDSKHLILCHKCQTMDSFLYVYYLF